MINNRLRLAFLCAGVWALPFLHAQPLPLLPPFPPLDEILSGEGSPSP